LSAVRNDNDIALYANSAKAVHPFGKLVCTSTWIWFRKGCKWSTCFHGEFFAV